MYYCLDTEDPNIKMMKYMEHLRN